MIFNEKFYENAAPFNPTFHVRSAGELFPDKSYCIERVGSETGTVMYITSGLLRLSYDDKSFILARGDAFILPPKRDYVIKSDQNEPVGILWVNVRGILFENIYKTLFPGDDFPIRARGLEKEIRSLFDALSDASNFEAASSLTIQIMLKIFSSPSSQSENPYDGKTLAGRFEYYISQRIQDGFSTADMCDYFNVSKDGLIRSFKRVLNTTPYRYYQNMRLYISKSLLLNSNLSIEEIADRLKFNDRNHFTSFFIKNAGVSPAKFRSLNERAK